MSVHHPCVLMGNAGGEVSATNYLRSVLATKSRNRPGKGAWNLKVVRADWRENKGMSSGSTEKTEERADGDVAMTENGQIEVPSTAAGANDVPNPKSEHEPSTTDLYHSQPTRKGITRLVFGWRATPVEIGRHEQKDKERDAAIATNRGRPKKESPRPADGEREREAEQRKGANAEVNTSVSDLTADPAVSNALVQNANQSQGPQPPSIALTNTSPSQLDPKPAQIKATTEAIFEEEQAVTALAWSQDRRTAGWAAVGWGSGLVMVTDEKGKAEWEVAYEADLEVDLESDRLEDPPSSTSEPSMPPQDEVHRGHLFRRVRYSHLHVHHVRGIRRHVRLDLGSHHGGPLEHVRHHHGRLGP
ncbi:uncharacterized protein AB675_1240 [Cyphellophora attinorum]|uniref:Uncharacterized protein n=1 Tax=Cyphellophora attinorum TaxID=1664694 RepID=A0A0N1NWR3_9EURO|nr:uncharacterized protein AB675_1240 [Phialophora attinorum]KPI35725.1 hypothetical protein AB675_1240 [Phialophora attinorum]